MSVGILNGKAYLDLDYQMDQNADVDFNVVMTDGGQFVEAQGTAEGEPFSKGAFNAMLLLAEMGIEELLRQRLLLQAEQQEETGDVARCSASGGGIADGCFVRVQCSAPVEPGDA